MRLSIYKPRFLLITLTMPNRIAKDPEFDSFAQDQDPLDVEAALWVARQLGGLGEQDTAELKAWLAGDPRRRQAYDTLMATFVGIQSMPKAQTDSLRELLPAKQAAPSGPGAADTARIDPAHASNPALRIDTANPSNRLSGFLRPPPRAASARRPPQPAAVPSRHALETRRQWLLGAGGAAVALGLAGGLWLGRHHWLDQAPIFTQAYQTAVGEQRAITLPDGSRIELDTATEISVQLYEHRRDVLLKQGQALFTVASNREQPFHVTAGAARVTVVGTQFVVRNTDTGVDAGSTFVAVSEGLVEVASLDEHGKPPYFWSQGRRVSKLTAGQAIRSGADGFLSPVMTVSPSTSTAWTKGRLHFTATPLAAALQEFERYAPTGVIVRDPRIAAMRVGGSFSRDNLAGFLQAIQAQLPVRVIREPQGLEIVAA